MAQSLEPFDRPGIANAEKGVVLLDGPDGVAIALTPDAAEATARNLISAAGQARREPAASSPPEPA